MKLLRSLALLLVGAVFFITVACAHREPPPPPKPSPLPGVKHRSERTHKDVEKETR